MEPWKSKISITTIFYSLSVLVLLLQGCATTTSTPVDPLAYKKRTESSVMGELTITVAVPTNSEAQAIYGVNLALKHIQPVWLEVKNDSNDTYWLLSSGLDPHYFFPSEAAYAFKTEVEKFQKLEFKNPIRPGSTQAGFVLVNLDEGFKAVDIDLLSREAVKSFSFIADDPEFRADYKLVNFETLYKAEDINNIEDEEELRQMLEELPRFTTNADDDEYGDPLNLVLIGEINDILPALVRRNWHATETTWSRAIRRTIKSFLLGARYRYSPISPLYVFGRPQDVGWQKARRTINERNHMRFWLSPIRFRGKKVFIGQISRDIGVKFTLKSPTISTHVIDPDVDEARRYFLEDLGYSQALAKYGFVKGAGVVNKEEPRVNLVGDPFYTDGLRVVLFFESRPYTISEIDYLPWETPSGFYGVSKQE
ncbi:MAG: hypothetical protein AMJ53_11790 [Gammaproteobacteria bacterium SG8_11]|nr:MAG: hypothetical protein AMJ53_11790 [Gammaproteobacteria bacterium SG8_11]